MKAGGCASYSTLGSASESWLEPIWASRPVSLAGWGRHCSWCEVNKTGASERGKHVAHLSTTGLLSMNDSTCRMYVIWPARPPLGCGHENSVIQTLAL